ncbi:hypothetical protein WR164_03590 [Philodulcilactobacillus myokoensis]|uniref:Tyrosine specific protein phosphatases domain-containing protein n=1 Tax=Philodulcilactobacillus myokoensis TaxID=2929573 RepID=A0A9W6B0P3_9LACO|nr:tyrosine-protein phosphatase [Philodulcilactobacillus myokoensis]GLB46380.1 hypothetical protein WR164_03590 [Philodulcilactobacillus myokoensis]
MRKATKLSIAAIAGLSFFGFNAINSQQHSTTQAYAASSISSKYNQYLSNVRVAKAAKQRQDFYYSNDLQGSWNTRDIGGVTTADGNFSVKPKRLIRGSDLAKLTKKGAKAAHQLNIKQIIDLRESQEIKKAADPGEGVKDSVGLNIPIKNIPVISLKEKIATTPAKNKYGEIYRYGYPLAFSKSAVNSYKDIFKAAMNNKNGAIMYHCIGGRDRTGTVSVLLLSALGVNKRNIYNDYLLSTYYIGLNKGRQNYVTQINQLNRFYSTIEAKYGNMDNYLHKVIGLSNKDIKKLRANYLTPNYSKLNQQKEIVKSNLQKWVSTQGSQRRVNKKAYYQSKASLQQLETTFKNF